MVRFIMAAIATLGLLGAAPALAATEVTTTLTFNSKGPIVDQFATMFGGVAGAPSTPAFTIYGGADITPGSSVFGAVSTPDFYVDRYFFLGVTGTSAGARHLVFGGNQSLAGQDFGALFPTYSETALIDAIVGLNAGTVPYFGAEYALVSGFQFTHGAQYAFDLKGTGYLTTFSDSDDYGTITTLQTSTNVPDAVPEPVTWAMMILGLGVTGLALRRRPSPSVYRARSA